MANILSSQLSLVISALNFAAIVFLLGYGLSLLFNSLNFMNLAHASFFSIGAYLTAALGLLLVGSLSGLPGVVVTLVAVLLVVPVAITLLSFVLKETVLDRLNELDEPSQLLGTFAVLFILEDSVRYVWGTGTIRAEMLSNMLGSIPIGATSVSGTMVFSIVIGVVAVGALSVMFSRSKIGKIISALSENPEIVSVAGINARFVHFQIYAISTTLAAVGGLLWVMNFGITIGLTLQFVLLAFAVMVIGGVGSLRGAIIAALMIGFIRTYGVRYLGGFEMAIVFLIMAVVIIIKPTGIGGAQAQ